MALKAGDTAYWTPIDHETGEPLGQETVLGHEVDSQAKLAYVSRADDETDEMFEVELEDLERPV